MTKDFEFSLGQKVKDRWSPFRGVVLARTQYMTGCNTYGVFDGKLDKDGKPHEWKWYDEPGLVGATPVAPGGPCNPSAPSR